MSLCINNYFRSPVKFFWDLSMKIKLTITIVTCLVLWSVMLLSFSNGFKHQLLSDSINASKDSKKPRDKLLGGLLTADFDEDSCLSRYQSSLYRKPLSYYTSQYLNSKLRSYEMLHKRCGPGTNAYKKATKKLDHDESYASKSVGECKYIVWIASYGLGNRILTLASVFLYALLIERVVLVDQRKDISDLFCEPFPDETLGIQIRVFSRRAGYFQHVMDQIITCTQREKLLPEVASQEESQVITTNTSKSPKLKAVLVTSLYPEYSINLKTMYWERPTSTGDIVEVYQPSGERVQQTDKKLHDQKALAEMYLLSLTDNIVTSARSTFGYVAHSLGGLKPWFLYLPVRGKASDPPCVKAISMEPCFLTPPTHGCEAKKGINSAKIVPFVRHCEDLRHDGLKLFDDIKDEL
ncbi:hypothetical protein AALP_AA1G155000 [Arabis alpina]|uniref:Fucosyltransferase n=1 Tax=Arabis alpina TaxID=50452 RepID=A0A087HNF0_ARAAL|nr:hypothetical protein AALP_AA1G155000 [Arabis alpina]